MSKRRIFITAALAVSLVAGSAAAASAHVAGNPYPSPSPTVTQPTPTPTVPTPVPQRAALWQFDFTGSQIDGLQLNDVRGVGAIAFTRWQEQDINPFVSKFFSPVSNNSVTLLHNRLPLPDFNIGTCTATFDQVGQFKIIAGTGIGAGLRVVPFTSRYILRGTVSFDRIAKHGYGPGNYGGHFATVCPLQFVSPWTLRFLVEHNNLQLSGELASLVDFDVQGNARLVRVTPLPVPTPTGTPGHFFAPAVTPTNS